MLPLPSLTHHGQSRVKEMKREFFWQQHACCLNVLILGREGSVALQHTIIVPSQEKLQYPYPTDSVLPAKLGPRH